MSPINIKMNNIFTITPVSNQFLDEYMVQLHPMYTVIFLFILRQYFKGNSELTTHYVAENLHILETDVHRALSKLQEEGLITYESNADSLVVTFLELQNAEKEKPAEAKPKNTKPEQKEDILQKSDAPLEAEEKKAVKKPTYSPEELHIYKENDADVKKLIGQGEDFLGRPLNHEELSSLFSLYDYYRLDFQMIYEILDYCKTHDKRNITYAEKTAITWQEKGISTCEDALVYIDLYNREFREILKACGITGRNPVKAEEAFMVKWRKDFDLPMDLIKYACEKAVMATGKANFNYVDRILVDYYERGLKDIKSIETADAVRKEEKSKKRVTQKAPSKTKFNNFKGRDFDYNALEGISDNQGVS